MPLWTGGIAQQAVIAKNDTRLNTLEDKIYGSSLLWSELKYNPAHIDKLDFDIDSLYRQTMSR